MTPFLMGGVIYGIHFTTFSFWVIFALFSTVTHHSGYHLPLMLSSEFHDYHHLLFNQCYGAIGLFDYLCQTDLKWRQSYQSQLHHTFFSLDGYPQEKKELKAQCDKFGRLKVKM